MLATKTIEPARISVLLRAGARLIGENRVQEVVAKSDELASIEHECQLIGPLQRNKINQLLPHVTCIQTVDSIELGQAIDSRVAALGRVMEVFIQVNVSQELTKSGITVAAAPQLLSDLAQLPNLIIRGYMTVGLNSGDSVAVRAGYRTLRELRDECAREHRPGAQSALELSMGMSGDFELAISEGATMVRVGSAIFGARQAQIG